MKLYYIYKTIPHYDPDEGEIFVAKNLFGTERCYLEENDCLEVFSQQKWNQFAQMEQTKEANLETMAKLKTYAEAHEKLTKKHLGNHQTLHKNLQTLRVLNEKRNYCYYNILGNEIWLNEKQTDFNAALAHEIGHMEFSEIKLDLENKKLFVYSGVVVETREVDNIHHMESYDEPSKEFHILQTTRTSVKNIGLEEFLNDAKSSKIVFNSVYPSVGQILEALVGEETCIKARNNHDVSFINEKLLALVNNNDSLNHLYQTMDAFFLAKKAEKANMENALFEAILPYTQKQLEINPNLTNEERNTLTNFRTVYSKQITEEKTRL